VREWACDRDSAVEIAGEGDLDSMRLLATGRLERVGLLGQGDPRNDEDEGEGALCGGGGESLDIGTTGSASPDGAKEVVFVVGDVVAALSFAGLTFSDLTFFTLGASAGTVSGFGYNSVC
jgi:hypothetical protein